jgi:hypothetical protein
VRPGRAEEEGRARAEEEEGASDTSESAELVPGDSFPAVAASLDTLSEGEGGAEAEEGEGPDTARLLARLTRGGSRMEQIKRQLVVQRGAIVSALRLLAESRQAGRSPSRAGGEGGDSQQGKLCPMCEVQFPAGAEEQFEQHVMDHFVWDSDQDTLLYQGEEEASERL